MPFLKLAGFTSNRGPQISFDRPELSRCLSHLADAKGPAHEEALSIIRSGKETLARRPRADMPGFSVCEVDARRQAKYAMRREAEAASREAIRTGRKAYDN